jgi:tRNA A37 methylthiotransferase MiaB
MPYFEKNRRVWFDMRGACRRRILECSRLMMYIRKNGFTVADKIEDADVLIVYRCCINTSREQASLNYLNEASSVFSDIVCLGGLAAIYSTGTLRQYAGNCRFHYVSLRDEASIDDLFAHTTLLHNVSLANCSWAEPSVYSIQVGLGCESNCSYCGDKKIVGPLQSYPSDAILNQFESGLQQGHREFDLVGDDVGAWGIDIGSDIIQLLDKITAFSGNYTVSMQEVNIKYLIKYIDQFEAILNRGKIKFLVVAFQHVNDRILKLMDRGYTGVEVEQLIHILTKHGVRKRFHAILGFPSESGEELRENVSFIGRNDFYSGSYFVYQPREYAPASRFSGHLSEAEIKQAIDFTCNHLTSAGYNVIDETCINNRENGDADRLLVTQ